MDRATENFLRHALKIGALEIVPEGRKLKSGRISPYFFNTGLFTTGKDLNVLAAAYAERYPPGRPGDVLFGPAYKGIPLVTAVSLKLYTEYEISVGWACNRKEAKDHGEGGIIIGASLQGKEVVIVDDVMTSGISSAEAVEIVKAHGGTPVGGLLAFDQQERGLETELSAVQEFERKFGVPVTAAATLQDLIVYLERDGHPALDAIKAYRRRYGVFADNDPIDEGRKYGPLPG